jgi:ATP synthase H subunit
MSEAGETLEAIRRTELEAARWVEEARDRSVEIVTGARARAREMVEEGRRRGRETARRRLEEAKERSELEADEVRAGGVAEAQGLARHAEERMDMLVDVLVEVVLAPPREKVS